MDAAFAALAGFAGVNVPLFNCSVSVATCFSSSEIRSVKAALSVSVVFRHAFNAAASSAMRGEEAQRISVSTPMKISSIRKSR